MRKLRTFFWGLLILSLAIIPAKAGAFGMGQSDDTAAKQWMQKATPFQADIETIIIAKNGQKNTSLSKYYFTKNKFRMDGLKDGSIVIVNLEKKVSYMFAKSANTWMKMTQAAAEETSRQVKMPEVKTEKLADALVDGKPCTVMAYSYIGANSRETATSTIYTWKGKHIPIKIVTNFQGGTTEMNYKNIALVNTPESFFELPAGAKVMDMSQMMKGKQG